MAKFLDDNGLSAVWAKIKEFCAGLMAASVYDPAGKSSQVATEAELEALPVKHLVGTDAAPVNLDGLLEPGIYYITGTQTTTKDACGLLDSAYVQSPLVVIGTTQRRHSNIGAGVRGRVFLNGMTIKIPPMDFMFKEKGVLTGNIDMGTHKITNLPAPTVDEDAATKGYVDTGLAEKSDTNHTHTADDVSFADGETFQAKLDAGKLNGADGKSAYQQAVDAGYTGTEAAFYAALVSMKDAPFLPESGGTMSGNLSMGGRSISDVANISSEQGQTLVIEGERISFGAAGLAGALTIGEFVGVDAPTAPAAVANKKYVDDAVAAKAERKTATGTLSTTGWTGSAGNWSQAVTVSWMLAADVPKARLTGTTAAQMDTWDTLEPYVDSAAGKVTFYCKQTAKPSAAMSVGIEVIR